MSKSFAPDPLRSLANSAFRDGRRIALVVGIVLACTAAAFVLKKPAYTAQATLLVLMSDEYAFRPDVLSSQAAPNVTMERDAILSSEVSILTGMGIARNTIVQIGLDRLYPSLAKPGWFARDDDEAARLDKAVDRFRKDFSATADKYGSTIAVSFRNPDRQVAADVVNRLLANYFDKRAAIYLNQQSSLVQVEVEKARVALDQVSNELQAYQSRQDITEFGTQMDLLLRRQADLQRAFQAASSEVEEGGRRVASARSRLSATPAQVVQYADAETDKRLQTLRDSLGELRRQESDLRQTYTDQSVKMVSIRRQIEALEGEVARLGAPESSVSAVRRGVNEVHAAAQIDLMRAENDLAAASARKHELQGQIAATETEVRNLQGKRNDLEALARQKSIAEQTFLAATRALQERRIAEDIIAKRAANTRVIEPAQPPLKPAPVRLAIAVGGVLLALLAGLTTAVLGERFRKTFLSPDEVERELGVPVFAAIGDGGAHAPLPVLSRPALAAPGS